MNIIPFFPFSKALRICIILYFHVFFLGCEYWNNSILSFSYEKQGRFRKVVKAQQLWYAIIESQTETGTPYMLYKDSCNRKSNQQNLGTIKCSNLCTEIVEYTSKDEVGREAP